MNKNRPGYKIGFNFDIDDKIPERILSYRNNRDFDKTVASIKELFELADMEIPEDLTDSSHCWFESRVGAFLLDLHSGSVDRLREER